MIKCVDNGIMTCISKNGNPKNRYRSADLAIRAAKISNDKYSNGLTKLVAYKCTHCHYYHLTTKSKRIRN